MLDKYVQIVFPYFFQCPTYRALPFWIDQFKAAIRSEEHYHHGDILEYLLENLLLLPQFLFRPLSLGDISSDGNARPVRKMYDRNYQIYDSAVLHPHFTVSPLAGGRGNKIEDPLAILRVGVKLGK